ncbi:MAG: hypothetical protein R2854_03685 [Caldilineaceae bacterium]
MTPHGDALGLSWLDLAPGDHYVTSAMGSHAGCVVGARSGDARLADCVCASLFGRRRYWPALVVWLLVGGVALLGMSRYTEVRFPLSLHRGDGFGVDFGAVRLEAAHVATTAPVHRTRHLYWTVNALTDALNAFVHVVDDAGAGGGPARRTAGR